jgi:hypothetical protein
VKRSLILAFLLLFVSGFVFSLDFGFDFRNGIEVKDTQFKYDAGLTPWFSFDTGNNFYAFLSCILTLRYDNYYNDTLNYDSWVFIPELSRFVFIFRVSEKVSLEAGRMEFSDVLAFTASGLFDGIRFKMTIPPGTISASFLFTGLLYKETANIIMTGADAADYNILFDGKNYNYYRASDRVIASIRMDMPLELPGTEAAKISADILTQFDLNDTDDYLHSQYAAALMEFYPGEMLKITGGLLFGAMQNAQSTGMAFGLLAQCKIDVPFTSAADLFGVTAKATFGSTDNGFNSYQPVSGIPQGYVFEGTLSGLTSLGADYNIKIIDSLFAECAIRYFISTYSLFVSDNLYGGELWASLAWQPLEEILVYLGGGLFIPGIGNVYPKDTGITWKIIAGITLSF